MTTAPIPARPNMMPGAARPVAQAAGTPTAVVALDPVRLVNKYKWVLVASGIFGMGLGFVGNEVLKQVAPVWRATMIYQVLPPVNNPTKAEEGAVDREEFERYAQTQTRVLSADRTVRDAVERNPQLREQTEWIKSYMKTDPATGLSVIAVADAAKDLKELVSARVISGTSLVEVGVTAKRREDVAIIATAIHQSYFEDLRNVTRASSGDRQAPLEAEQSRLQTELETLAKTEEEIITKNKITSREENGSGLSNKEQTLNGALATSDQQLQLAMVELKKLEDQMKREGGIAFNDVQREQAERDQQVMQLKTQLVNLRTDDDSLQQRGFGVSHKDRQLIHARLEATQKELDNERERVLQKIFYSDKDRAEQVVRGEQARQLELVRQRDEVRLDLQRITAARKRLEDIQANKDNVRRRLAEIQGALGDISLANELVRGERIGRIRRLEAPRTPDVITFPRLVFMLPFGVFVAVSLTAGAIVLIEVLEQRVRGPADLASIPRAKLLGIVPLASEDPTKPASPELAFRDAPNGAISEGFRQIRATISKRISQTGYKSLLVMAGAPGSGATTTAANLAMGFAASEMRVLLIDANMRKPGLHRVLKLGEGPGLADVLAKKADFKAAVQQTSIPNLSLLSAGSAANRAIPERLATESMTHLIREASEQYDFVIIDAAPGVVASDAIAIANRCDATLMVIKALGEKRGLIARMRDQLADSRGEFLGVVINAVRSSSGGYMRQNIRTSYEYQAGSPA